MVDYNFKLIKPKFYMVRNRLSLYLKSNNQRKSAKALRNRREGNTKYFVAMRFEEAPRWGAKKETGRKTWIFFPEIPISLDHIWRR